MDEKELMGNMKISKAVMKMAVPSVISSLVTVVYNTYLYPSDGLCQYAGYGRKRGAFYGAGSAE
ncbi:MAG TPA: hypothetical protein IAA05_09225 [Candidatus Blautia excrementipullorum]|nr:hypothetical protein [Candidatus Blautia excrementipullorum]